MRRRVPIPLAVFVLAASTLALGGGSAFAYFASPGSGTAEGKITSLSTPTISAATAAAGGTVTLTWGAVSPPGSGTVTYYVTRDGGEPATARPKTPREPPSPAKTPKSRSANTATGSSPSGRPGARRARSKRRK